jgi:hypothetical protein
MGFRPGKQWAMMAGLSEFGGGALTALGLAHPVGPLSTLGAMAVATLDVHAGKPVWVSEGGAELPITNMAAALALALAGPGAFSLARVGNSRSQGRGRPGDAWRRSRGGAGGDPAEAGTADDRGGGSGAAVRRRWQCV